MRFLTHLVLFGGLLLGTPIAYHQDSGSQTSACIRITWKACSNRACWAPGLTFLWEPLWECTTHLTYRSCVGLPRYVNTWKNTWGASQQRDSSIFLWGGQWDCHQRVMVLQHTSGVISGKLLPSPYFRFLICEMLLIEVFPRVVQRRMY